MKAITTRQTKAYKAIFEDAPISILLIDNHGYIKLTNPKTDHLFGYKPGELIEQSVDILIPPAFRKSLKNRVSEYFDNLPLKTSDILELNATKKDGTSFPIEINLGQYAATPKQMVTLFLSDMTLRKKNEQALFEDDKRLRDIIQSISDAFMSFTHEWKYLYVNEKALAILGKPREEILGQSIWDFFPYALGETFEREFRRRHESTVVPFTIKTQHGSVWWHVRVTHCNSGMAVLCSDITEARYAREAQHQSEEQFSTIFNSSPSAISISELESGIMVDINQSHSLLYGFSKEELVGKTVVETGIFKDFIPRDQIIALIKKNGTIRNFEATARTKNGNQIHILISADIIHLAKKEYLLVASIDITANRNAMEELQRSEERFAKAFRASPVALSISTMKEGRMIEVNNGFLELFGYSLDEVIGRTSGDLNMYPNSKERSNTIAQLREQGFIRNKELVCNTKHNAKIHVIFSMEMIELYGESCVITTALDITDKKKAEDKLKSYTDLLEQKVTERTLELTHALEREKEVSDMKSRFVSIASHEFRTPLSTILSSTYLLEQLKDSEDQAKHFNRIRSAVKNLTFILTEFLSLDKLEQKKVTVEPEVFDLDTLASEILDEVRIAYHLSLPVNYIHTGTRFIFQDKRIIRNILLNLLSNAAKYSPKDKIITLTTEVSDKQLTIQVIDEGIGIPLEDQKYIFTKFFRAHNASYVQGTGLGLSITKKYVELLGGSIGFQSSPQSGTQFTTVFPIQEAVETKDPMSSSTYE